MNLILHHKEWFGSFGEWCQLSGNCWRDFINCKSNKTEHSWFHHSFLWKSALTCFSSIFWSSKIIVLPFELSFRLMVQLMGQLKSLILFPVQVAEEFRNWRSAIWASKVSTSEYISSHHHSSKRIRGYHTMFIFTEYLKISKSKHTGLQSND